MEKSVKYRCVAPNCGNNSNTNREGQRLTFHSFPSDIELRNKWLASMKKPSFKPAKTSKICSLHFESECFVRNRDAAFSLSASSVPGFRNLLPNVVPTIFDFINEPSTSRVKEMEFSLLRVTVETQTPKNLGVQSKKVQTDERLCRIVSHRVAQTDPIKTKEASTQTEEDLNYLHQCLNRDQDDDYEEEEEEIPDAGEFMSSQDPSYTPSQLSEDEVNLSRQFKEGEDLFKERKFMVFESALLQLFTFCAICLSKCTTVMSTKGSMVIVQATCCNNHKVKWQSQPEISRKPAGNILTAAAILFSGMNPTKAIRMLQMIGIQMFDKRTYYRIQKAYLLRAINTVWESEQRCLLESLQGKPLCLGGDGRCDSPGFSAKYGSYCFLESSIKKIIHLVLIQSSQVANSVAMELEGLKKGLSYLYDKGMTVAYLVTDRHKQVRRYLKENYPRITHLFDCWHLVKSLKSKIAQACGTKKYMRDVKSWSRSIQNHMYWLANSSGGDGELMKSKWLSVLRHVTNQHKDHGMPYNECAHGELDEERPKYWLELGKKPFLILQKIVKSLQEDVKQMSSVCQTSSVEAYHAVVIHFAPKHTHYSFHGMEARLILAALHYNENSSKLQATTKDGIRRWNIYFPKAKAGEFSVRPIMAASTYNYVERLMAQVIEYSGAETYATGTDRTANVLGPQPQTLCHKHEHPDKDFAIESYSKRRRFEEEK